MLVLFMVRPLVTLNTSNIHRRYYSVKFFRVPLGKNADRKLQLWNSPIMNTTVALQEGIHPSTFLSLRHRVCSRLMLGGALISTLRRGVWRSRSINIQWSRAREGPKWSCLFIFDRVYCYRNTVFPAIKYSVHGI